MKKALLIALLCFLSSPAWSHDNEIKTVQVNRYSHSVVGIDKPTDPLSQLVSVNFDDSVITHFQALNYLLMDTGYSLAPEQSWDPLFFDFLELKLPKIYRFFPTARLDAILNTLGGEPWVLITDPVNRLVSYELKPIYWPCNYIPESDGGCAAQ